MLATSPGADPRTSACARYGRRHPWSKGPSKEFIFFSSREMGRILTTCNGRKPIGSRSSLLPAASMFSFLSPHASAKASYTAFSFSSIARETTNPNSSPKHAYLPRLRQSHRCMCLAYHELCIYNKTNSKATNETDYK